MYRLDSLIAETMEVTEKNKIPMICFGDFSIQELDLPLLVHYPVNVDISMKIEILSIRLYKYVPILCNPVSNCIFSCLINRGRWCVCAFSVINEQSVAL